MTYYEFIWIYASVCPRQRHPRRHETGPLQMPQNVAHLFWVRFWIYSRVYLSRQFFAFNMATPAPICATQGVFTRLFESKIACIQGWV